MTGATQVGSPQLGMLAPSRRTEITLLTVAMAIPLLFAAYTNHAWEDYYITLRSSRNLVEGHGLVFQPGERVHTFTSPLGVLVPAACLWITGGSDPASLALFRLISAGFLAVAAIVVWRQLADLGTGRFGRVLALALLITDAKLVDFSINGMETALVVCFALLFWSALEQRGGTGSVRLAVATAGLMWTRPDGFVLGIAIAIPHLIFRRADAPGRLLATGSFWRGVLTGGLLYLPWFLWAWSYYGSPVPHTIIAKSAFTPPVDAGYFALLPLRTIQGRTMLLDLYLPAYWVFGGWPRAIQTVGQVLAIISAFAWLIPGCPAAARRLSLAVFLGMFYLCSIIFFPWYAPPWTALSFLAIAIGADAAYSFASRTGWRWVRPASRVACSLLVLIQAGLLVGTAIQMEVHQRVVETGVRRQVGQWLRQNARSGDTLFLEPLGYIGYFSRLKTFDFPGLSSPEVVDAVRRGATSYSALIGQLRPDWIVLRPAEAMRPDFDGNPVLSEYELVRTWDGLAQLEAEEILPGRPWSEFESRYGLFRRKAAADRDSPR